MKLIGVISTAVLSLTLGAAAPAYAQQEQHDQQDEQKVQPAQDEKKAQPEKPAKQEDKNAKPAEKNAQQEKNTKPEEKNAQQAKPAAAGAACQRRPHSRRPLQGQLWTGTHVSCEPRRLQ